MMDGENNLASCNGVCLMVCCLAEFTLVSGAVSFAEADKLPVRRIFRFIFDWHYSPLLSSIAACSGVMYCHDCGGRVMPMSESGTVEILTGSWTPQT